MNKNLRKLVDEHFKLSQVFLEVHTTSPLEMEQTQLSVDSAFPRSVVLFFPATSLFGCILFQMALNTLLSAYI